MLPVRKSIRLKDYDYSTEGLYFVTICAKDKLHLFGYVSDGVMYYNEKGQKVIERWNDLPNHYPNVILHDFCVMPNHIHGVIQLTNDTTNDTSERQPLSAIIRSLKSFSTREINQLDGTEGRTIWQRGYYEHIIRNDEQYDMIARYIAENPSRWESDRFY